MFTLIPAKIKYKIDVTSRLQKLLIYLLITNSPAEKYCVEQQNTFGIKINCVYKALVHPCLEYLCTVRSPSCTIHNKQIENVQRFT